MELSQLLADLNVDAPGLLNRFSGNEALAKRFLLKFPSDATYSRLKAACEANDFGAIANEAHSLKGIALNLGLNNLGNQSSELCEYMRAGKTDGLQAFFDGITSEYERVSKLISEFN